MAIFLARTSVTRGNKTYRYWVLRQNYWDAETGSQRQRYLASLGRTPRVSRARAREICQDHGLDLAELRRINGLGVVETDEAEGPLPEDAPSTVGLPAPHPAPRSLYDKLVAIAEQLDWDLPQVELAALIRVFQSKDYNESQIVREFRQLAATEDPD